MLKLSPSFHLQWKPQWHRITIPDLSNRCIESYCKNNLSFTLEINFKASNGKFWLEWFSKVFVHFSFPCLFFFFFFFCLTGNLAQRSCLMSWIVHSEISDHWIDLEMIILSEGRQRKTNIIWYCVYVESKKDTNELIYKIDFHRQRRLMINRENLWLW